MVSSGPLASWITHVITLRGPTAEGHIRIDGSLLESTGGSILASAEEKRAYVPHGLKLGYVRLEKDAVDGTAPKRHVIPE
jgi:hypothetical protein